MTLDRASAIALGQKNGLAFVSFVSNKPAFALLAGSQAKTACWFRHLMERK
jgi:hypothetical protein